MASHHATNEPQNLMESTPMTGHKHVFVGSGQGLSISRGFTLFPPLLSKTKLSLNDLHVPTITKNLVSVSRFSRDICLFLVSSN